MIVFENIRYKNLLGTGNAWIEIPLNTFKSTLVMGINGAGKSTFLDALIYCLYGRPYRNINQNQLVNSINNKDMLTETNLHNDVHKYRIIRGLKPKIFEIYEDDKLKNQPSDSRDYQEFIETQILKMNLKAFTQIVVIGIASYVPFMRLSAPNRRTVIEDILDIQIFSIMNSLLKQKLQNNKDNIVDVNNQITLAEQRIELFQKHLESINENIQAIIDQKEAKIDENEDIIEEIAEKVAELSRQTEGLIKELKNETTIQERKTELLKLRSDILVKSKKLELDIQFLEKNTTCPTCTQNVDEKFKNRKIKEKKKTIVEMNNALPKLNFKIENIEKNILKFKEIHDKINELGIQEKQYEKDIAIHQHYNQELEKDIADLNTNKEKVDEEEFLSLKEKLLDYHQSQEELIVNKYIYELAESLLSDGGIKTQIIKQYIPIMNKLINKYLASMEFMCKFELDETFNETIRSRYRDEFTYNSFSAGEKLRIDLALLFTWRAIAKLRNSASTNLLVIDEIFDSSLDSNGTDDFIKILNSLTQDTNTFIISHKHDLVDKFDRTIRFEKVKNFSKITVEENIL